MKEFCEKHGITEAQFLGHGIIKDSAPAQVLPIILAIIMLLIQIGKILLQLIS